MAASNNDSGSEVAELSVDLRIRTNITESIVSILDIPSSTTVGQVKARARNELDTTVPSERLRLIYRGRVLPNEQETLLAVFGVEALRQSKEQNLHLVVPDPARIHPHAPTTDPPRPTVTPSNPFRASSSNVATPDASINTNPFRTAQAPSRPGSNPQALPQQIPPQGLPLPGGPIHFPPTGLPSEIDNMIRQQIDMAQRAHAHANAHGNHAHLPPHRSGVSTPQSPSSMGSSTVSDNGQPRWAQPNVFQQVIAQQQQQRAAAAGGQTPDQEHQTSPNTIGSEGQQQQPSGSQPQRPASVNVVHREMTGPNGARFSVHIEQRGLPAPTPHGGMPAPNQPPMPGMMGMPFPGFPHRMGTPHFARTQTPQAQLSAQQAGVRAAIEHMRRNGQNVLDRIATYNTNEAEDPEAATRELSNMRREVEGIMNSVQNTENVLATLDRTTQNIPTPAVVNAAVNTPPALQPRPFNLHPPPANAAPQPGSSEVFLLTGPQGPYALLLSPSGSYTTGPLHSQRNYVPSLPSSMAYSDSPSQPDANNNAGNARQEPVQAVARDGDAANVRRVAVPAGQPAVQAQAARNDQRAMPLAQGLWIFVRLLFFLYMFTSNSGWRRPLMIGVIALAVYAHQLGWFNTPIEIMRRHLETLMPLPEERRRQQQQEGQQTRDGQRGTPTPEQTAQRLLQQRDENNASWFRDQLRVIERGVALFFASLVPGIGERMIATREERLRREREAAEQAQRDREAQAAEASATSATSATESSDAAPANNPPLPDASSENASSAVKGKENASADAGEDTPESAHASGATSQSGSRPSERRPFEAES